jgi:ABC-2 type transport system ATP-binding protein
VVVLESADPALLASKVEQRFATHAAVLGNKVRVEIANGHRFAAEAVEAFRGEVTSVSISKPTLEDVFIARTGHRFWGEGQTEENTR